MIFGIGTDIVQVARLQRNLDRFGEKFAARILSSVELDEIRNHSRPAHFLARRFAVKEAAAKALGTGIADGLLLRHIGTEHDGNGKPRLVFTGRALELARAQAITSMHVSIADEHDYAVAFVVLETA